MDSLKKPYQYANRNEVELTLHVKEGILPKDIYGVMYLTSMCGSLNSNGLPIPEKHPEDSYENPEYGTPQLAGDGMMFKIDFNSPGEAHLKTLINKPPCYYADLATDRKNSLTIESKFSDYGFKSAGMTRASMQLGFRNELSVAVIPMQFHEDKHPRMLVTFDAGRPWEFNTESLELITPIEKYDAWIKGTPPGLKFPFYLIQTSAHPSFDPVTKELYTVNYMQEKSAGYKIAFFLLLLEHRDEIREHLGEHESLFDKIRNALKSGVGVLKHLAKDISLFFDKTDDLEGFKEVLTFILQKHHLTSEDLKKTINSLDSTNEVFLMKWNGKQEPLKKWRVVNEDGSDIIIDECMHQTSLTEDYILLSDSSFKFSADLLINSPTEIPVVDKMLRLLLNKRSPVDMTLYIVKRSDLTDQNTVVKAKKVALPEDCIHFSANYKNPDGNITLYTINNNSVCLAEWIRPYDTLKIGGEPAYKEIVGLPAMSAMDLNSLSRYVINSNTGVTSRLDCIATGGSGPGKVNQAHTWEVCLLTYRDMIAPNKAVDEIKNLYVFSAGLNSQRLTTFMYDLFKDTPDKIIPTEEVLKYTEEGVTQALFRLETKEMQIKDSFMPDFNQEIRSVQFIPRRHEREGVEYSMNGYILCIMLIGESNVPNAPTTMDYEREFWIFEADNLAQGPICKLNHPDLSYAFTLHSAWIEEAKEQDSGYQIDVIEDFSNPESFYPGVEKNLKEFFEKYIYPNFEKKNNKKLNA